MTEEESAIVKRARKMSNMLDNKDFVELFVDGFIQGDITEIALRDDVTNERVQHQLIARKILNDWIRDTITAGETLIEQNS